MPDQAESSVCDRIINRILVVSVSLFVLVMLYVRFVEFGNELEVAALGYLQNEAFFEQQRRWRYEDERTHEPQQVRIPDLELDNSTPEQLVVQRCDADPECGSWCDGDYWGRWYSSTDVYIANREIANFWLQTAFQSVTDHTTVSPDCGAPPDILSRSIADAARLIRTIDALTIMPTITDLERAQLELSRQYLDYYIAAVKLCTDLFEKQTK